MTELKIKDTTDINPESVPDKPKEVDSAILEQNKKRKASDKSDDAEKKVKKPSVRTTVVRLKRRNGQVVQGCDVYIGRANNMGGWNLPRSIWANPFTVKEYGRKKCLEKYEAHVRASPVLMSQLPSLEGKVLGCWCKPEACHGDVLVKLLNEMSS